MIEKTQTEIQKRLGQLLADSFLAEEIKKAILNGLDKLPDYMVFDLIDALENEKQELERIAIDINLFLEQQDDDWQSLENEQQAAIDKLTEEEMKKIEEEAELSTARQQAAEY